MAECRHKKDFPKISKHFRFTTKQDEILRRCAGVLGMSQTEVIIRALSLLDMVTVKNGGGYFEEDED